jgi:restriction system protein
MSEKSLFAYLLRSPWWISIVLMVLVALVARALLPEPYLAVGTLGGFPFLVIGLMAAWRQRHAPDPTRMAQLLENLATMSWQEFSAELAKAFSAQGYTVSHIQGGAADLQLEKNGQTSLVSAKRWKAATVGVEFLFELLAMKESKKADACICISRGHVTNKARRFAEENAIRLIPETELAALMAARPGRFKASRS